MKELSKETIFKIENGLPLGSDGLNEIWDFNEDFVERKRQIIIASLGGYEGLERIVKAHEERIRKSRQSQQ